MDRKVVLLVVACSLAVGGCKQGKTGGSSASRQSILHREMAYLEELPEVAWYEVQGNNVYVGFRTLPVDWKTVINGAALHGNKAIDFGCHVWAVHADKRGWRPGDGPFYGESTARYGRLE